ncbi:MAG: serine hydroxymethyltransferase [Myxococcota bacterium]|nr:serine hydroxymethyltransferase [Myxococcota bacterium]
MTLEFADPEVHALIRDEGKRQFDTIRLIPSENYASAAVLEATGSVLTNKYSEGYANKRYYEGQEFIDPLELLTIARAKSLFGADHVNVQPYSGSPANLAVYSGLLQPGDTLMGMSLPHGGHLTHGWKVSVTGKLYRAVQYKVDETSHRLDFDEIRELALKERPKMIIAGATAYPRIVDFEAFASRAKEVGAYLHADIAHISGLVAGGAHPSPVPYADTVVSTTHKTLRGPRGGMILCKSEHAKTIDRAVFPGLQGGPHNHTTAALAVALKEASTSEFKAYAHQIVANARALAGRLIEQGFTLVTGGTDNHLILFDATSRGSTGRRLSRALNRAGIITNANTVPFDPRKPFDPSGVRIGTPAVTSRGMKEPEMGHIGNFISRVLEHEDDVDALDAIGREVADFCRQFPAPGIPNAA